MKLALKTIFISGFLFLSLPVLAWTTDYVSAFKPTQKSKGLSELQRSIKKDIFQIRSMIKTNEKTVTGLVENRKYIKIKRNPADI